MKVLFKYGLAVALGIGVGTYLQRPVSFEEIGNLNWRDEAEFVIDKIFAPEMPKAAVASFDATAAEQVDEDLDYRITQRLATLDGWRAFLAAHGNGAHAETAKAEIDKLTGAAEGPAGNPAETARSASGSGDAAATDPTPQEASAAPGATALPSSGTDPATQASNENAADPSSAPTAATDAKEALAPDSPVDDSDLLPPTKSRATSSKLRSLAGGPLPPRRPTIGCGNKSDCARKALPLPPILLALFSMKPKHVGSPERTPADARASGLPGR
jgi:hypothetical protein